jgi:hypothetical protein
MVTVTYLKETLKPLYLDAQATTPLDPRVSVFSFQLGLHQNRVSGS